jgi:hypothetical protein
MKRGVVDAFNRSVVKRRSIFFGGHAAPRKSIR